MPKIYTRTGDAGETALFGGGRVRKDEVRVEALGAVDELNAAIGAVRAELARSGTAPAELDSLLARLQHQLFDLGAELATPNPRPSSTPSVSERHVAGLERAIDDYEAELEPLRAFILPGGVPAAAGLHVARGVCRRAERRMVALSAEAPIRGELLQYMNRLSDLLFVLARAVNKAHRLPDITWQQGESAR
jgi:cob(I)alamin adenosyltransferase